MCRGLLRQAAGFDSMAGTTANTVSVGFVKGISPHQRPSDVVEGGWTEQCSPRLAECEDIADTVGVLCSKDARWITGSGIPASGGHIRLR